MSDDVWYLVGWVGGICLCIVIILVTINIGVAVVRNVARPKQLPPPMYPPRGKAPWDGNGRG
jgi:hypothetical protein